MKIKVAPEGIAEWFALQANLVPLPLVHTQIYPLISKAILDAHTLGIFEALRNNPASLEEVAEATHLDPQALKSLMNVLIVSGYILCSKNQYRLTRMSRKWCLKDSGHGLYNMQAYNQVTWKWLDYLPTYLKTGKGLQYHNNFDAHEWELYQKGMENIASIAAKSLTSTGPKLHKPETMLDIGGSHGLFSLEYVKKYKGLHATILDLPQAVDKAEPLLRKHYKGKDIKYVKGDALTADFGENKYDFILIASLMHHFTAKQNYEVCKKAFRALKNNGFLVIHEFLKPKQNAKRETVSAVMNLFFNISSTSGIWSAEELIDFQEKAGLTFIAIKKFIPVPGLVNVIAQKRG